MLELEGEPTVSEQSVVLARRAPVMVFSHQVVGTRKTYAFDAITSVNEALLSFRDHRGLA